MKKLSILFLPLMALFFIYPYSDAQTIEVSEDISENTTWMADTVKIENDITVNPGTTLTIQAGTVIQFQGHYKFIVRGTVVAEGTPDSMILFTIADTTGFSDPDTAGGGWNGIKIDNTDWSMWNSDSSVFRYCKFEYGKYIVAGDEWSDFGGGVMVIRNFSKILIRHCVFRVNHSASNGGAMFIGNDCSPEIDHCAFLENETASAGGAICLKYNSNPVIHHCLFYKNTSHLGGAIWSHFGKGKLLNNIFSNNTAYYNGGALYLNSSNEKIIGNLIINNDAHEGGGGVSNNESWPEFNNNHVCYNNSGWGGGMQFWSMTNADLYNNIFWGNTEDWSGSKSPMQINISSSNATPNFYNCIIQDGIAGIPDYHGKSQNIIEYDPQFDNPPANTGTDADGLDAEWTLSVTSPAINNGNNTIEDEILVEIDLMGHPRIMHGIIDIGAIETRIDSLTVSDTIDENTLWIADTIRVTGDIVIKDSVTLSIAPGTFIEFQGYYGIQVFGTIKAKGSKQFPITFTVNDTTGFSDRSSVAGSWKGMIFDNSQWLANGVMSDNDSSILRYCVVQYAKYFPTDWNSLQGGAIRIRYFSNLEISNCTLQYNISQQGGALSIDMYSHPLISGNLIYRNIATDRGGGIFICNKSKPGIVNNYILNNAALDDDTLTNRGGGGIMIYAASPYILNNVICNNSADFAGGICIGSSKPILVGNTVCNNLVSDNSPALVEWDSKFNVYNSIFWGNTSTNDWWATKQIGISNPQNFYHNNIQGGEEGINLPWGVPLGDYSGNINDDPVFTNPTEGPGIEYDALQADWSLTDYSPNINKGFPESGQLNLPDKDIAGKNRMRYDIIDIGAYENQGEPIHITRQPFNQIACKGDTIKFIVGVEGIASFQWLKDGEEIPGADTNRLVLDSVTMSDMADYICVISNGYGRLLSNNVTLVVNSPPEILLQTESQWVKEDDNLKLEIHARGTEPVSYEWLKDGVPVQEEMMPEFRINKMSYDDEGSYICQISNQCGHIQSTPITLFVAPQICMVTVDLETGNNLVIWEKKGSAPVSSYNIYRESIVAGEYEMIGHLPKDSLSVFLDTVSDPSKQAFIYKITAIDTDGFESNIDLCKPHKTIHLITSINMTTGDSQLEWDQYYGFIYGTYYIYRSLTESNFSIIHSMSSSTSAYTDPNPENLLYYYRISVERPEDCIPTGVGKKAGSGPYSHSMSNIEDNRLQTSDVESFTSTREGLMIYPNPFSEYCTLHFPNPEHLEYQIIIRNLSGEVIIVINNITEEELIIERNTLEAGYYLIEVLGDKVFRGKMIIE